MDPVFHEELSEAVDSISKSLMRNVTEGTRDKCRNSDTVLNIKPSKILEHCSHVEVPSSATATNGAGPDNFVDFDSVKSETESDTIPKKRGRKPNSLINSEGYDHSCIGTSKDTLRLPHHRKPDEKGVGFVKQNLEDADVQLKDGKMTESIELSFQINESIGASASHNSSLPGRSQLRRGWSKRKATMATENSDPNSSLTKGLELKTHILEKLTPSAGGSLKMKCEAKTLDPKRKKRSRRVEIDAKTNQAPPYFVQEKEGMIQSDIVEKKLQQPTVKNYNNKNNITLNDDDDMLGKSISGASGNQV